MRPACLIALCLFALPAGAQERGAASVTVNPAPAANVTIIRPAPGRHVVPITTADPASAEDNAADAEARTTDKGPVAKIEPQAGAAAAPAEAAAVTTAPGTSAYIPAVPGEAAPPRAEPVPVPESNIGSAPEPAAASPTPAPESLPLDMDRAVARFSSDPDTYSQAEGEALYRTTCEACHMPDGKGAKGAGEYPPLVGNPKLISKYFIVTVLLTGYHGMPRFGDQMSDAQIAAVANYVRDGLGDNAFAGAVSEEDVTRLRGD